MDCCKNAYKKIGEGIYLKINGSAIKTFLNIKKLILYHIDHDGNEMLHECKYLKEEVIRMLNHYKKKLKIKKSLDRDKPVIIG